MSSGGTVSVLHVDAAENLLCLIDGKKELILMEPKYAIDTYMDEKTGKEWGASPIDVDAVDLIRFPNVLNTKYYIATLNAGDLIYIPHWWLHQVRSYDRNVAVNIQWNMWRQYDWHERSSAAGSFANQVQYHEELVLIGAPQTIECNPYSDVNYFPAK